MSEAVPRTNPLPARPGRAPTTTATLLLAAAVLAAAVALIFVALRGPSHPATLAERARSVGQSLRCPTCQDLSVADSPSAIAREIRADIRRRLAAGQTPYAIRDLYVGRYGPWILLSPPASGVTLFAWLVPGLLVGAGIAMAAVAIRRWTTATPGPVGPADELPVADRRLLDRALSAMTTEDPE